MANVIKGKDFALLVNTPDGYKTVCYARGCSLDLSHETRRKTTKQNSKWDIFGYGRASYTITIDGLLNAVPGNGGFLQDALLNGDTIVWTFTDGINFQWDGEVLVQSASIGAQFDSLSSFGNQLLGTGEPNKVLLPTANLDPDESGSGGTPLPPVEFVTITDQTGEVVTKVPAPSTYIVTRFDVLDGGSSTTTTYPLTITPSIL